ncbi:MAG: DUF4386 family protein, partial [Anaerolineae bacterium]|nr:DUF4386 family protein [Anaerolineae bacterium]
MTERANNTLIEDRTWTSLYRIGGAAALIAVLIFRRNLGAEISLVSGQMPPIAAGDWLALLQNDRLLGLAYLNLFDIVNYALVGLMFIALYVALRRVSRSAMGIAVSLGLIGVAVYFASNQAFSMASLSDRYGAATTDAQRAVFLAAGEALLAINNPGATYQGTGIYLSLLLVTLAGLIISIVMLRSGIFGKMNAYLGILAHVLLLGYFVALIFAPALTFVPHTAAAIPLVIWQLLIGRRLLQLARQAPKEAAHAH